MHHDDQVAQDFGSGFTNNGPDVFKQGWLIFTGVWEKENNLVIISKLCKFIRQ